MPRVAPVISAVSMAFQCPSCDLLGLNDLCYYFQQCLLRATRQIEGLTRGGAKVRKIPRKLVLGAALIFFAAGAAASGDILLDRKSTRLNSSHVAISYAVFCLK